MTHPVPSADPPPSPKVRIRAAGPDDLVEIVRLCADHAAFEQSTYDPAGKAEALGAMLFDSAPRLACLVADSGAGLVGYATWSREASTWDAAFFAHMDCLYLDAGARSSGAGRRLMERLAADALAAGCRLIQWQTPAFNVRAMRFYDRLGATRKEKVRFYLDADAMQRLAGTAPA